VTATRDQATAAVLGAVLLSPKVFDVLLEERLRPEHFWRSHERAIFATMRQIADGGRQIDALTLKHRLLRPGSPVGEAHIDMLAGAVPNLSAVRDYCRIVREEAWFEAASEQITRAQERLVDKDRDGTLAALHSLDSLDRPARERVDPATEFMAWYEHDRVGVKLPFGELTEATGGGFEAAA
jgi:replicative DNA helicase